MRNLSLPRAERERRLASLDTAIKRGMANAEAGRVHEAEDVFAELEARIAALSNDQPE